MGVSTDAILFWGFCWDDEDKQPWDKNGEQTNDYEKRCAAAMGVKTPEMPYPEYENDHSPKAESARRAYSKYWNQCRKALKASGCKIIYHCSDECTMYGIAIEASVITARRGYPEHVESLAIGAVKQEWHSILFNFCEKMDVDVKKLEPRRWLVSYWG